MLEPVAVDASHAFECGEREEDLGPSDGVDRDRAMVRLGNGADPTE